MFCGRANNLQRRKERIERQLAAGQEVFAAELQAADLCLLRHVVNKGVERNHDQRITARQGKVAHVGLMESWRQTQSGRLRAQRLEHRLEQVQPLDIDAGLQARQQNPARAAGDVQHRAIRLARQGDVEIKPVRDVFEHQIVRVAIIKDRRQAAGGLFVHKGSLLLVASR